MKRNEEDNAYIVKLYGDELKVKENDLEARTNQIKSLEAEIGILQSKILHLEERIKGSNNKNIKDGVLLLSQEYDFYDSEQKDIILKVLKGEYGKMSGDVNQRSTRKYHIIQSVLQNNEICDNSKEIISQIRRVFSSDLKMTGALRRDISNLGFSIEDRAHYKLTYNDDERYAFTMSKTSSDGRAAKNLRSEILKVLFSRTD